MDSKTYEYMNEKIEKYKRLENKKSAAEESLKGLGVNGSVVIPEDVIDSVVMATKRILKNHIQVLEREMEEI